MLRKNGTGTPFHYNPHLANANDMVIVEMTLAEISSVSGAPATHKQEDIKTKTSDKPGPGWVQSKSGKWVRKNKNKLRNGVG